MRLSDKTAVVTGGATGIGWGIAQALAREGCRVVIAGRREEKLKTSVGTWVGPPQMWWHRVDVADRPSVRELFEWSEATLGSIDILVNSAGINIVTRSMAEMDPGQWDQVLAVNATGTYNCMYMVLPKCARGAMA